MKTIFSLMKTAKEYNKAVDDVLLSHEGDGRKSAIYWHCVPKLYGDYLFPKSAVNYLADCKEDGQSYSDSVENYAYSIREELDEIISTLKEIHAPYDFKHMEENLAGTQALLEYLQVIDKYWHDLL